MPHKELEKCKATLSTFWQRFRAAYDDNTIFQDVGQADLALTVPIKVHGDEGRSTLAAFVLVLFFARLCVCCPCPASFVLSWQRKISQLRNFALPCFVFILFFPFVLSCRPPDSGHNGDYVHWNAKSSWQAPHGPNVFTLTATRFAFYCMTCCDLTEWTKVMMLNRPR